MTLHSLTQCILPNRFCLCQRQNIQRYKILSLFFISFIHWPQFKDTLQWNVLCIFKVALLDCETGRLHNFENGTERSVILMSLHKVVSQEGEGTSCVPEPLKFIHSMHVFPPASVWISSHRNQYFNSKNNNSGFLWEHCFTYVVFRQWFTGLISIRSKPWAVTIEPLSQKPLSHFTFGRWF